MTTTIRRLSYSEARGMVLDGDVGLCRLTDGPIPERAGTTDSVIDYLIVKEGKCPYEHAWMFTWSHARLLCLEQRSRFGGQCNRVSYRMPDYPQGIDVYRCTQDQYQFAAVKAMLGCLGKPYGTGSIVLFALHAMLPFLPAPTSKLPAWLRYVLHVSVVCSSTVAEAYLRAGRNLYPGIDPLAMDVGRLARSPFLTYQFTMIPDIEEVPV